MILNWICLRLTHLQTAQDLFDIGDASKEGEDLDVAEGDDSLGLGLSELELQISSMVVEVLPFVSSLDASNECALHRPFSLLVGVHCEGVLL